MLINQIYSHSLMFLGGDVDPDRESDAISRIDALAAEVRTITAPKPSVIFPPFAGSGRKLVVPLGRRVRTVVCDDAALDVVDRPRLAIGTVVNRYWDHVDGICRYDVETDDYGLIEGTTVAIPPVDGDTIPMVTITIRDDEP